jgi:hypothetical protein
MTHEGKGEQRMRRELLLLAASTMLSTFTARPPAQPNAEFGPSNPFYAESSLPFHAPPFDKIKDTDYQPAIEAGMAQQLAEVRTIAANHGRRRPSRIPSCRWRRAGASSIARCRHSRA